MWGEEIESALADQQLVLNVPTNCETSGKPFSLRIVFLTF
jgi:hypothetical protein